MDAIGSALFGALAIAFVMCWFWAVVIWVRAIVITKRSGIPNLPALSLSPKHPARELTGNFILAIFCSLMVVFLAAFVGVFFGTAR